MDGTTDETPTVTDTPESTAAPVAPEATPAPAVADFIVGTSAPAVTPAPSQPTRPLDQIHSELLAAKAAHQTALATAKASQTMLATLAAEYHAALTWFGQEEKTILADIDDMETGIGAWLMKELKKL